MPYDSKASNCVGLMSEVLLTYCFFGIMACLYTTEPKQKYNVGWLSVSAIITLVLVCVFYLTSDSVSRLLEWIKKKLAIRRRLREIERRNQEAALARQEIQEVRVVAPVPTVANIETR